MLYIYTFTCQSCHALYIGKTCQNLHTSVCEHIWAFRPTQVMKFLLRLNYLVYSHAIRKPDTRFHLKILLFFLLVFLSLRSFLEKVCKTYFQTKSFPYPNINSFQLALFWCHLLALTPHPLSHFYILCLPRLFNYSNPQSFYGLF